MTAPRRSRWLNPSRLPSYDEPASEWFDVFGAACLALTLLVCVGTPCVLLWLAVR